MQARTEKPCRTVMMLKDSEVPRRSVLVALLSTEDSNNSQKRVRAVLTIHPTLAGADPGFSDGVP